MRKLDALMPDLLMIALGLALVSGLLVGVVLMVQVLVFILTGSKAVWMED